MIATYLDKYAKHILTIPSLLIIIVLIVYPSIYLVRMCFPEYDLTYMPTPEFNGLENFKLLVKDQYFLGALLNTFDYLDYRSNPGICVRIVAFFAG